MTVTFSKELRKLLQNLHKLEVDGTKPFIEHDGLQYIRFDKITIEPGPAKFWGLNEIVATYHWHNVPVVHIRMESTDVLTQMIVLTGMTGEMEARLL